MAFWMACPLMRDWSPLEVDDEDMARSETDWEANRVPGGSENKKGSESSRLFVQIDLPKSTVGIKLAVDLATS